MGEVSEFSGRYMQPFRKLLTSSFWVLKWF